MPDILTLDRLPNYLQEALRNHSGREVCPKCDGGSTCEESLSIRSLDDGVIHKLSCWRATCGWYAYVGGVDVKVVTRKVKPGSVYRDPALPLSFELREMLAYTYGLKPLFITAHGWSEAESTATLVMPVRDPYGRTRGHVTRTFDTPKRCYTYKATSQPWLDWWFDKDNPAPVVIVEDALSACRLQGCGFNSVALLGTSMTTEQAQEIAQVSQERPIHLALDNDAFAKATRLANRHAHILHMEKLHCLTVDIKEMDSDDNIREMFGGRNTTSSCDVPQQESL